MSKPKEKKDKDIDLNMFINVLEDGDRKIERPISAPPPGLIQQDNSYTPPTESIDSRLLDYKYYLYYYSLKPLDPRLPKPLIHWDKNMTEGYYKAFVKSVLEKEKYTSNMLIDDFQRKAKINEVNENSSDDNFNADALDVELNDFSGPEDPNQRGVPLIIGGHSLNKSPQKVITPQMYNPNPNNINLNNMGGFIKNQNQNQNNFNQMNSNQRNQNTYQPFGYSQTPQNLIYPSPNVGNNSNMLQRGMGINQYNNQGFNFQNNNQMGFNFMQNNSPVTGGSMFNYRPPPQSQPFNSNPMFLGGNQFQNNNFIPNKFNIPQPPQFNMQNNKMTVFEMCQDQNGSRAIQQQFELGNDQEKENIYNSIQENIIILMKDVFGNYVVQKIFEKGDAKIKKMIHDNIKPHILDLSLHMYGCRVVQKSLEVFKENYKLQNEIINELRSHVMKLIQDQNGNHVIQKCFETVPSNKLEFIVDEVIANIDNLAFHAFGCRVIQKILEYSNPVKTTPILKKLMDNIIRLSECQYGNYIIQHIIEKGSSEEKDKVLNTIKQGFVDLSVNKFASNVTEKAVMHCSEEYRRDILNILFKTSSNHEMGILRMMKNAFGNYVVQRLYEYCDVESKNKIYNKINQPDILNELRKNNYGKHVLSFIEKNQKEMMH